MAKTHKTCMEQEEIIDTFGTYQLLIVGKPEIQKQQKTGTGTGVH